MCVCVYMSSDAIEIMIQNIMKRIILFIYNMPHKLSMIYIPEIFVHFYLKYRGLPLKNKITW